jgi:transposase
MQHLCKKYGSELRIVNESLASPMQSKTCGNCGILNENLGSSCHFQCSNCEYQLDRDVHGAINPF